MGKINGEGSSVEMGGVQMTTSNCTVEFVDFSEINNKASSEFTNLCQQFGAWTRCNYVIVVHIMFSILLVKPLVVFVKYAYRQRVMFRKLIV